VFRIVAWDERSFMRRCWLLVGLAVLALMPEGCRSGRRDARSDGLPPDRECLAFLRAHDVPAVPAGAPQGVRTPVRITGSFAHLALAPRARHQPVMDCALARALLEAAPIFGSLGIQTLEFSSAYDYRTRRHSDRLSAHAHGLAIDVHVLRGPRQQLLVERDFEKGVGHWRRLRPAPGALDRCIGHPTTVPGTTLRKLVCRLKLHTAFQVVVTPDDDADHRDHLHLEVYPDATPPAESEPRDEGRAPRPARAAAPI
jgi:hypothetical protein